MARLGDHEWRAGSDDLARFAEDHLDAPRIGVTGELACAIGRLDPGELDDATLDLRDGLLSDDEHVVVLEPARARGGIGEERTEIVSFLQLRDSPERDDAQLVGQPRPVTRIPAWPL